MDDSVPEGLVIKQGWLSKADPHGERWGDRFFVLLPTNIAYYLRETKGDSDLRGAFYLSRATLSVGWPLGPAKRPPADKKFLFYIALPDRTFYFAAPTLNSFNSWVATIERQLAALQDREPNPELAMLDGGFGPAPVNPSRMSAGVHSAIEQAAAAGLQSPHSNNNDAAVGLRTVSSSFQMAASAPSPAALPVAGAAAPVSDRQIEGLQAQLAELQSQYAAFSTIRSPMDTYSQYRSTSTGRTTSTRNNNTSAEPAAAAASAPAPSSSSSPRAEFAPVVVEPVEAPPVRVPTPTAEVVKGGSNEQPQAAAPTEEDAPITFYVNFVGGSGDSNSKQFTMAVKPSKRDALTMKSIKKKIAKAINDANVTAENLVLSVRAAEGGGEDSSSATSTTTMILEDDWTARDIDLTEGAVLTLTVMTSTKEEEQPAAANSENKQSAASPGGSAARSVPPPPPPRPGNNIGVVGQRQARSSVVVHGHGDNARKSLYVGAAAAAAALSHGNGDSFNSRGGSPSAGTSGTGSGHRRHSSAGGSGGSGGGSGARPSISAQQRKNATGVSTAGTIPAGSSTSRPPSPTTTKTVDAEAASIAAQAALVAELAATAAVASQQRVSHLRTLFVEAAAGTGSNGSVVNRVSRTDLAAVLSSDPVAATWPETEALTRTLIAPMSTVFGSILSSSGNSNGDDAVITWEELVAVTAEITSHFHRIAAEEEGRRRAEQVRIEAANKAAAHEAAQIAAALQATTATTTTTPAMSGDSSSVSNAAAAAAIAALLEQQQQLQQQQASASALVPAVSAPRSPPAAAPAPSSKRRQHVMVMTVEGGDGITEDLHVSSTTDPDALALDFITRHNLNQHEFLKPLAEEIRKSLVEALALELVDSEAARSAAEARCSSLDAQLRHATVALASSANSSSFSPSKPSFSASAIATANNTPGPLMSSSLTSANLSGAEAITALAVSQAELAETRARLIESQARVEVLEKEAIQLRSALHQANSAKEGLESVTTSVTNELGQLKAQVQALLADNEQLKLQAAANNAAAGSRTLFPSSGDAASASATGVGGDSWRSWAQEKRELLARANADRSTLMEENKRLRTALDSRASEVEKQLREADSERADLKAQVVTLTTSVNRSELELKAVYQKWQQDAHTWASERQALSDQLQMLATALQQRELAMAQAGLSSSSNGPSSAFALASEQQGQHKQAHQQQQ